jgi:hypothetical protein
MGKFKGLFRLVQRGVYYAARCLIPCRHRAVTVPSAKFTHSLCKFGTKQGLWDPLKIPDVCEETHLDPYEFIYARYEFDPSTQRTNAAMIQLYKKWPRLQVGAFAVCIRARVRLGACYFLRRWSGTGGYRAVGAVLRVSVCEACCVGVESFARTASGPAHVPMWHVNHTVPRSATCSSFLHAVFSPTDHCTNCNTHSLPVAHTRTADPRRDPPAGVLGH